MKPKTIKFTPIFLKSLKKLPPTQLKFLAKQEQIFRQDIFDPRLKTHKLKGELSDFYAFPFPTTGESFFILKKIMKLSFLTKLALTRSTNNL